MCWIILYSDLDHSKNNSNSRTSHKLASGVISAFLSLIVSVADSTLVKKSVLFFLIIGSLFINRTGGKINVILKPLFVMINVVLYSY